VHLVKLPNLAAPKKGVAVMVPVFCRSAERKDSRLSAAKSRRTQVEAQTAAQVVAAAPRFENRPSPQAVVVRTNRRKPREP
jgi:hypothetical protein